MPTPSHRFPSTIHTRRLRATLGLLGSLMLGACLATPPKETVLQPSPKQATVAAAASPPEALMQQITAEIGSARCEQDSQCRSLPLGHKACGGPAGHLAWSTAVSQESRLLALAQRHQQAERQAVEKSGRISDCMLVSDPGARCNAQTQRCELNPRGRGGPSAM
ncbi:MAG: hypothetical protein KA375_17610 [Vitreoscilla sp.]|nr:hypothetical protein [Vitreoscilla sp.]MBP6676891.1 hypothetical protein [Vitreoscilla sp.]